MLAAELQVRSHVLAILDEPLELPHLQVINVAQPAPLRPGGDDAQDAGRKLRQRPRQQQASGVRVRLVGGVDVQYFLHAILRARRADLVAQQPVEPPREAPGAQPPVPLGRLRGSGTSAAGAFVKLHSQMRPGVGRIPDLPLDDVEDGGAAALALLAEELRQERRLAPAHASLQHQVTRGRRLNPPADVLGQAAARDVVGDRPGQFAAAVDAASGDRACRQPFQGRLHLHESARSPRGSRRWGR